MLINHIINTIIISIAKNHHGKLPYSFRMNGVDIEFGQQRDLDVGCNHIYMLDCLFELAR
jgi:hypothetical protein